MMNARTNKFGQTILKGNVSQAPTLPIRCKQQAASVQGLPKRLRPMVAAEAVALVQEYPQLTAKQAVGYVVSRL